jgi:hypothetical protein
MHTKLSDSTIQLGEPIEHRGIVIAPLFPRRQPQAEYLTLEEAIPLGLRVTEVDAAGSVPELLVTNPLEANILLYDGEELIGAKQNRILNVTVLAPAQSETRIPVSCVEEGRWSARSGAFSPAPHTAYHELRRVKADMLSAEPMALGIAQAQVWEEVRSKAARLSAESPTGAEADMFRSREDDLALRRNAFPYLPGQSGTLFALGAQRLCLDYVSRPESFARLYSKLLDGYLLDGIEYAGQKAASAEALDAFIAQVAEAPRSRRRSVGLGDDIRLRRDGVVGSGLELEGELLQLCAFSTDASTAAAHTTIARPARRRSS